MKSTMKSAMNSAMIKDYIAQALSHDGNVLHGGGVDHFSMIRVDQN